MRKRNNQGETMLCRHFTTDITATTIDHKQSSSMLVPSQQVQVAAESQSSKHRHQQRQQEPWSFPVGRNVHHRSWGKRTAIKMAGTKASATTRTPGNRLRQAKPWTAADFSILQKLGEGHFGSVFQARLVSDGSTTATSVVCGRRAEQDVRDDMDDNDSNNNGSIQDDDDIRDNKDGSKGGTSTAFPKFVALKRFCKFRIRQSQQRHNRALELLHREINIQSHLKHDHILKFLGYYQDPTHISLVLEYCALGDLVSHMAHWRGRQQRLERCRLYLRQVAAALVYLGQLQVAHRDLKPENMVLTTKDTVKLCDFGWAVWWQPGQFQRTLCGTAEYVVPEMLRGSKDERKYRAEFVDPWALGILAVELVQGASPFCLTEADFEMVELPEKNEQEIIFEKIRRFPGMDKTIPANEMADKEMTSFWDLVSRLVQIEPESRISASEVLEHAFLCPHDDTTMVTDTDSSASTDLRPTVAQRCQIFEQSTLSSSSSRFAA